MQPTREFISAGAHGIADTLAKAPSSLSLPLLLLPRTPSTVLPFKSRGNVPKIIPGAKRVVIKIPSSLLANDGTRRILCSATPTFFPSYIVPLVPPPSSPFPASRVKYANPSLINPTLHKFFIELWGARNPRVGLRSPERECWPLSILRWNVAVLRWKRAPLMPLPRLHWMEVRNNRRHSVRNWYLRSRLQHEKLENNADRGEKEHTPGQRGRTSKRRI